MNHQETENIRSSRNLPFHEIVNIAGQMWHQSLARELRTSKEILGTSQSLGCNIDGHHPHEVIDDVSSGTMGCLAGYVKRKILQ